MRRAALLPALMMLASCASNPCSDEPGTCLWVDFQGDVGPLDTLELQLSGAVNGQSSFAMPSGASRLPVALPVLLPDATGTVLGRGRGLGGNVVLGEGESSADVTPGAHVKMVIALAMNEECSNGVRDGAETDVDCGGSCSACADGASCQADGDCQSSHCDTTLGRCVPKGCFDGVHDGTETDVDCGGADCPARCDTGKVCASSIDCASGWCVGLICG